MFLISCIFLVNKMNKTSVQRLMHLPNKQYVKQLFIKLEKLKLRRNISIVYWINLQIDHLLIWFK